MIGGKRKSKRVERILVTPSRPRIFSENSELLPQSRMSQISSQVGLK
jgi:hypothetical protein